ncbi:TIGR04452 family lipoprotein [Leptospira sp. 96542]|nr:TIGR04452 family lipoprotein [Leptospira sp. 96542]
MRRFILSILFFSYFANCMLTETLGLPTYGAIKGDEAKTRISDAILEAEATASAFWLSQNGMGGGVGPISPLLLINGFLAKVLYPFTTKIQDNDHFMESSVLQCESDIRTKGALTLGVTMSGLAPSGSLGSGRDASLLPDFASCDLVKTGKIITMEGILKL